MHHQTDSTERMKNLLVALLALALSAGAGGPTMAQEQPGKRQTFAGIPLVVLSGTHYERGYAHGKALAKNIVDLYDNYLTKDTSPALFLYTLRAVGPLMKTDKGFQEEAKGLVKGATEAGGGQFRSSRLDEDFTWQDVLALSSYVDYVGANCSSMSAWGKATADSKLKGKAAIARNLDWSCARGLLRNQALFVHVPKEEDELPFISVGFAGFLGCLSCMNKAGLGGFLNLGYSDRAGTFPPDKPFTPAALAFRKAIETRPGKDSDSLLSHFVTLLTSTSRVGSFIIHAVAPRTGEEDPAVVVELLPGEFELRKALDDPEFGSEILMATNHNRKAGSPRFCRRYEDALTFSKKLKGSFTIDQLWEVLSVVQRSDTMQSMLFMPGTGEFRLSVLQPSGLLKKLGTTRMTDPESTTLEALFKLAR